MNTKQQLNVLATIAMVAMIASINGLSTVNAEKHTVLSFKVHEDEIRNNYTYQEMSALVDKNESFEDIEGINLVVGKDVYVYSNEGKNGNFVFAYKVTLKED